MDRQISKFVLAAVIAFSGILFLALPKIFLVIKISAMMEVIIFGVMGFIFIYTVDKFHKRKLAEIIGTSTSVNQLLAIHNIIFFGLLMFGKYWMDEYKTAKLLHLDYTSSQSIMLISFLLAAYFLYQYYKLKYRK